MDRDAVGAVAPIDEEGQHLAPAQHAEDLPEVAPRDDRDAPRSSRSARRCSKSSGNEESSATTLIGIPWRAIAAMTASLLPTWPTAKISPPRADARDAVELVDVDVRDHRGHLVDRPGRQAHQLDEVAPVLVIGAQRQPADARIVGRQPEDVPEVAVRPAPLGRPRQVGALDGGADHLAGEALRDDVGQPRGRLVGDDGQTLDDAGAAAPASMRSLESALAGDAAGRSAAAVGHFAAVVATWAFVPASLRYVRLATFSVPTRVSSSSPRMNASTRLNAMSSWICWGGLFMK